MRYSCLAVAALALGLAAGEVRKDQEDRAIELMEDFLERPFANGSKRNRPLMLRLFFHDCFESETCNGCVNVNAEQNKGLEDILGGSTDYENDIRLVYRQLKNEFRADTMSMADFVVLGAHVAVSGPTGPVNLKTMPPAQRQLVYGRQDLADCSKEQSVRNLPEAELSFRQVDAVFGRNGLGFSRSEYTALILGAHSFGRAHKRHSGYQGVWVASDFGKPLSAGANENRFERDLIRMLLKVEFVQVEVPKTNEHQWIPKGSTIGASTPFALNSDLTLAYFTQTPNGVDVAGCANGTFAASCGKSPTYDQLKEFMKDDGKYFKRTFYRALKMVSMLGLSEKKQKTLSQAVGYKQQYHSYTDYTDYYESSGYGVTETDLNWPTPSWPTKAPTKKPTKAPIATQPPNPDVWPTERPTRKPTRPTTSAPIATQPPQTPTTQAPTTQAPTTQAPTTQSPTTQAPTTKAPTTQAPTTKAPTTQAPTTQSPTTKAPTTQAPTTQSPTTQAPTTKAPTTQAPTTNSPTTQAPTTHAPTGSPTPWPTTAWPTTAAPTTKSPTHSPTESPTQEPSGGQPPKPTPQPTPTNWIRTKKPTGQPTDAAKYTREGNVETSGSVAVPVGGAIFGVLAVAGVAFFVIKRTRESRSGEQSFALSASGAQAPRVVMNPRFTAA